MVEGLGFDGEKASRRRLKDGLASGQETLNHALRGLKKRSPADKLSRKSVQEVSKLKFFRVGRSPQLLDLDGARCRVRTCWQSLLR